MISHVILVVLLAAVGVRAFAFLPVPTKAPGFRMPIALSMKSMAEKVLQNPKFPPEWPYSAEDFKRMDESDDSIFYDSPRLVSGSVVGSGWNASETFP